MQKEQGVILQFSVTAVPHPQTQPSLAGIPVGRTAGAVAAHQMGSLQEAADLHASQAHHWHRSFTTHDFKAAFVQAADESGLVRALDLV